MNKRLLTRLAKFIFKLSVPIIGIVCLIQYWSSEFVVDKVHYGIFMLAMLIIMIDNTHGNNGKRSLAS
jgi:hypothetical protein